MFEHHKRRLVTWTSPGGYLNQIDYIHGNAKTHLGATLNTDHSLLYCKMRIKLRNLNKGKRLIEFNVEAFKNLF